MSERIEIQRGSGNVFRDLGFSAKEARHLTLRSELMSRIERFVMGSGLTHAAAARGPGITRPRLSALLRGKFNQFSLDVLLTIAAHVGLHIAKGQLRRETAGIRWRLSMRRSLWKAAGLQFEQELLARHAEHLITPEPPLAPVEQIATTRRTGRSRG